jgi:hypothetical protein
LFSTSYIRCDCFNLKNKILLTSFFTDDPSNWINWLFGLITVFGPSNLVWDIRIQNFNFWPVHCFIIFVDSPSFEHFQTMLGETRRTQTSACLYTGKHLVVWFEKLSHFLVICGFFLTAYHLFPFLLDTWIMFWFFWIFCMDHTSWVLSLKSKHTQKWETKHCEC